MSVYPVETMTPARIKIQGLIVIHPLLVWDWLDKDQFLQYTH